MEPHVERSNLLLSRRSRTRVAGAAAVFFLALRVGVGAQSVQPVSILGVKNGLLEKAATGAVDMAMKKLAQPECQRVLSDFRDRSGSVLQSNLDSLGYSPTHFLEILRFANGDRVDACQSRRVLAATAPGSHVIYLCGAQFFERQRVSPEFTAALVIHEMLHSLGLGENPPSSNDITMRVLDRCGSEALKKDPVILAQLGR